MNEVDQELGFGYVRLSQDGKSIPEQIEMIEDYADAFGIEIDHIYNDGRFESAYTEDRPEYQAMLERIRRGEVDHVIVRDAARLSRDRKHRMMLLLQLDQMGVDVHAVERGYGNNPIDLDEPWSVTREAAQADADDVEKRKEADRGKAESERRKKHGLPNGRPPRGLRYNREKTALVPGEGYDEVREVITLRDGGTSWRAIEDLTGVPQATARRIYDRRELYVEAREA